MTETEHTSIHDINAVETLRRRCRIDPGQIRLFRNAALKNFRDDVTLIEKFPFASDLKLHHLELAERRDSGTDGASKLIFRTSAGMLIETVVLRIASGRTTLCVSSQVGCAAACDFCATAKMGIAQNLTSDEILDQVLLAGQLLAHEDRRIRNVVFMGMGEPFHNEHNLFEALNGLQATTGFNFPARRLMVSTVGIVDGMLRCAERFPDVKLAISLHSVRQDVRESLIPLARKYPLTDLCEAIAEANRIQPTHVMLEYLMLAGQNDSERDALDLVEWTDGLDVHINLMPFNPIADAPHLSGSSRETIDAFGAILKSRGLKTTIRYSLGADIAAACGQLVQRENRRVAQLETRPG